MFTVQSNAVDGRCVKDTSAEFHLTGISFGDDVIADSQRDSLHSMRFEVDKISTVEDDAVGLTMASVVES
jgi:hypothetical protein